MKYSIIVNTCDKFEDCWDPFFKLFAKYWNNCTGKIYLNTEIKDYHYSNLDIIPVQGCLGKTIEGKYATWSQCLAWALDKIPDEIILYLQEDYFIKAKVDNDIIERYVNLMVEHPDISCIHLTDQGTKPSKLKSYDDLFVADCKQDYLVSCQAALWRKTELRRIIRTRESAWEFEKLGSKRAKDYKSVYLCVDRKKVVLNKSEIIPYVFTGIVKGKWIKEVPALFEANGIVIDYSKRGFWDKNVSRPLLLRVRHFLGTLPNLLLYYIELIKFKLL